MYVLITGQHLGNINEVCQILHNLQLVDCIFLFINQIIDQLKRSRIATRAPLFNNEI